MSRMIQKEEMQSCNNELGNSEKKIVRIYRAETPRPPGKITEAKDSTQWNNLELSKFPSN